MIVYPARHLHMPAMILSLHQHDNIALKASGFHLEPDPYKPLV